MIYHCEAWTCDFDPEPAILIEAEESEKFHDEAEARAWCWRKIMEGYAVHVVVRDN